MKSKLLLVAAVIVFAVVGAQAQDQGDIRANGGLTFLVSPHGGDGRIGFGLGGEYFFMD